MAANADVLIGDQGGEHVSIRPLSRSHPGLFDHWDGNWINCELQMTVGGFRGSFRADLRSEEFWTFSQELEVLCRTLEGAASLSTIEGQIALAVTRNAKGHVRVTGEAIDIAGTGNRLQFAFDIDQTYLAPICRSLDDLLAAFPVIEAPNA